MHQSVDLYRVWVQDYEGRYTAISMDVSLLLKARQIQVDVDLLKWNLQKQWNLQKHRIPGFTPYIKGLELALNF